MRRVVHSVSALWLVVLFALPFTAPFPTCDLIPGSQSAQHGSMPPSSSTVMHDGTYSVLPTLGTEPGRLKLAIISPVDTVERLGQVEAPNVTAPTRQLAAIRQVQSQTLRL